MTTMQQKYKKHRLQGKNKTESARLAGYSDPNAQSPRIEKSVKVGIMEAFEKQGITDEYMAKKFKEEIEAEESKWNSDKKCWDNFIAHGIRVKALDIASKIRGYFKDVEITNHNLIQQVIINATNTDNKAVRDGTRIDQQLQSIQASILKSENEGSGSDTFQEDVESPVTPGGSRIEADGTEKADKSDSAEGKTGGHINGQLGNDIPQGTHEKE